MPREVWKAGKIRVARRREKEKKREGAKGEERKKNKKLKGERMIEVKKVVEEWEIWDEEEAVAKSEEEAKKLVPQRFHKWIYVFGNKVSERMLTKKLWNYVIEVKKKFVLRKEKVYPLSRKERGEMHDVIVCLDTNIFLFFYLFYFL